MEIKDLQANQGKVDLVVEIVEKQEPRTFEKFGKTGTVCNVKVKDASGEVKMTLWNEDVNKVKLGDKIHLENGWCSEYQGEKQVSTGKFGKLEVLEKSSDEIVYTNDSELLAGKASTDEESLEDDEEDPVDEEEFVD